MATDPICGMTVDEKTARSAVRDGVTFFFCSEGCLRKFTGDAAPAATPPCCGSHRPAAKAPAGRADAIYTCPMHPQIEQDHHGA
jgi:YHS domain-containing protein